MAINFPSSPANNQYFLDTASGNQYVYNAAKGQWRFFANSILSNATSGQVLVDNNNVIAGYNGLTFSTSEIGRAHV